MKVIARSLLVLSVSLLLTSPAATAGSTDRLSQLSILEKRFLSRSFEKEKESKRVERLERIVFGEASEGDLDQRIEKLVSAVPQEAASSSGYSTQADSMPPASANQNRTNYQPANPVADNRSESETSGTADPYPKIGAIEKALLGTVDTNLDLDARLSRLEEKAFGKTKPNVAYCDRTDALKSYVEKKTHKKLFVPPAYSDVADANGDPQYEEQKPKRSKLPGIINALSTAVFGPVMNPMYGPAMGNVGFGGVRVRHKDDVVQDSETEEEPVRRPESPLVYKKVPPPDSANLLTKVAWCEVQMFGHTMSSMHLPQRLENINGELEYKPGKSGVNLMDDVNSMMKLVAQKYKQNRAIGTGQQPPVR